MKHLFYRSIRLFILALYVAQICACDQSESVADIESEADFQLRNDEVFVGEMVEFINKSTNISSTTSYFWDFGDGSSSVEKNPTHIFKEFGTYVITLETLDEENEKSSKSLEIMVCLSSELQDGKTLRERFANLNDTILVCAHRGVHDKSPENSIASINESIEHHISLVEIDIRQSRDGELVLMHDDTIDRTTNGNGKVSDYTLTELKGFYLNHDNKLTSQQIPTLAEVLELSRGKIYIDLDVKIENFIKVYNLVKLYGMVNQVIFTVDEIATAKNLISNDERVVVMPIIRNESDFDYYTQSNLNLVVLHYTSDSFNSQLINKAHEKNLQVFRLVYVNTNTTPDSDSYKQIDDLIELKGNIVQTDYAVELQSYLDQ